MAVAVFGAVSAEPSEKPAPAAGAAAPSAKPPKVMLLLLVLNLGATGFVVFKTLTAKPAAAAPHAGEHVEKPVTAEVTGPVMALDPFVVNLNEPGTARYVRVNIQIETSSPQAEAAVKKSLLLVRDVILSHLSGLRLADTLGAQAKEKLRLELLAKLGASIGSDKIRRIFFGEFVVQ